jgi:hypothetical protein
MHSFPRYCLEVCSQFHTPATLSSSKDPRPSVLTLYRGLGGPHSRSGRCSCPVSNRTRFLSYPSRTLVTILTELSQPLPLYIFFVPLEEKQSFSGQLVSSSEASAPIAFQYTTPSTLKMEAENACETFVPILQMIQCDITETSNLHSSLQVNVP